MSIIAAREILPRTYQHRLGESPTASRVWNLTVTDHVRADLALRAAGAFLGGTHPDYPVLQVLDVNVEEVDRFHVQVSANYGVPEDEEDFVTDKWSFATGGAEVPALTYYEGAGNANKQALVNGAGDYFEGLTTKEAEVRATISWRRPTFPASLAAAVTNTVNSSAFAFGGVHTWLCAGISAQMETEIVDDVVQTYWTGTSELIYRASGWNLLIPNIGFNFKDGGQKVRAWVEFQNDDGTVERVPAANAVALNHDGSRRAPDLAPVILSRRVFPEVDFNQYFGTPPA
jgi:hypothetical protein